MFENNYPFIKVGCKSTFNHNNYVRTHIYAFRTERYRYLIEVEQYLNEIFIIKFYRKQDKSRDCKFNILTHENNCTKIVSTCIQVLIRILQTHPKASFGFLGSHTIDGDKVEARNNTKRFKVYKAAMENLIGDTVFAHSMDVIHSTYLMINKQNEPEDEFLTTAREMFEDLFPSMEF